MPRHVSEARIQDKTARTRLATRQRPYWRQLSEGCHLGYYKGARKGSWMVRRLTGRRSNTYLTAVLGEADDIRPADGETVLDWKQAFTKAVRWFELQEQRGEMSPALDPGITIQAAVKIYIAMRDRRRTAQVGRDVHSDAHFKLGRHVLGDKALAAVRLSNLTEADLKAWQMRRLKRLAPSSLQRIAAELKAALTGAWIEHRRVLPRDLPTTIKYGLKVETPAVLNYQARDNQILTDEQVRLIVSEALKVDEDFGRLVLLLAATGARFAQVRRILVGDVQASQRRIMVPESFKGKKRACQHIRIQLGSDTLAALAPIIGERPLSAPLLERWRYRQVGPAKWERVQRGPWTTASEMSRMWRQTIDNAGLPRAIIPYALRHSSIVRAIRMNLPIRLVAALHDTSVVMIERHYSRWITDGLDELAARAVVPMLAAA